MGSRRVLRLFTTGLAGLAGSAALLAGVIACGPSGPPSPGVYYSLIEQGSFSKRKSDKELIVWIPWDKKQTYSAGAKKFISDALGADSNGMITASDSLQGYKVTFAFADDKSNSGAENSGSAVSQLLQAAEVNTLPDILIGYPNVAATFAYVGLLHDFGEKAVSAVVPGYQFEVNSIRLANGSTPNYTLPFAKTTDGIGFDVVVMAKIFADTAALYEPSATFKIPANSDQDRMIRMILAPSQVSSKTDDAGKEIKIVDLRMQGIYDANTSPGAEGMATYKWSDLAGAWKQKTAAGAVWELDRNVVETNFSLKNTDEAKKSLKDIDYSVNIFGNFKRLASFCKGIKDAYDLKRIFDPAGSTFVMGYDAFTNAISSYQYDIAGHSLDKTFINAGRVNVDGKQMVDALRYELLHPDNSKSFIEAADWLSDGVKSGVTYLKYDNSHYGSELIKKHQLLLSVGSTNGFPFYFEKPDAKYGIIRSANANVGEIYYTLQPTKADETETKHSVTNQGPSLFVLDTHGKSVGQDIAQKVLSAYKVGASVVDGKDAGYWFDNGYLYGNKETYEDSTGYLAALSNLVENPLNWGETIGKKLLVEYLRSSVSAPNNYDIHYLPVNVHSSEILDFIKTTYQSSFVNFFQNPANSMPSGKDVALKTAWTGVSSSWLKKADDDTLVI